MPASRSAIRRSSSAAQAASTPSSGSLSSESISKPARSAASGDDPPLCTTCRHATVIKGARLRDEIRQCTELYPHRRIPFPVVTCSAYSDRRRPSVREMEDIAWVLRSDSRKKNGIGFVLATELSSLERHRLSEEGAPCASLGRLLGSSFYSKDIELRKVFQTRGA